MDEGRQRSRELPDFPRSFSRRTRKGNPGTVPRKKCRGGYNSTAEKELQKEAPEEGKRLSMSKDVAVALNARLGNAHSPGNSHLLRQH